MASGNTITINGVIGGGCKLKCTITKVRVTADGNIIYTLQYATSANTIDITYDGTNITDFTAAAGS